MYEFQKNGVYFHFAIHKNTDCIKTHHTAHDGA